MAGNILIKYLDWHFFDQVGFLVKVWRNFLKFNLNYFSVPLLLKTLFAPWRKYQWSYPKGFNVGGYLETFFSNLISRILGAILRIILIFFGIGVEIFIVVGGLIALLGWLVLPILLILGIYYGFNILF